MSVDFVMFELIVVFIISLFVKFSVLLVNMLMFVVLSSMLVFFISSLRFIILRFILLLVSVFSVLLN